MISNTSTAPSLSDCSSNSRLPPPESETSENSLLNLFNTALETEQMTDPKTLERFLITKNIPLEKRNELLAIFKIVFPWLLGGNTAQNTRMVYEIASVPLLHRENFLSEVSFAVMLPKKDSDKVQVLKILKKMTSCNRRNVLDNAFLLKDNTHSETLIKDLLELPLRERSDIVSWVKDLIQSKMVKEFSSWFGFILRLSSKERENFRAIFPLLHTVDDVDTILNLLILLRIIPCAHREEMFKIVMSLENKKNWPKRSNVERKLILTLFKIPKKRREIVLNLAEPLITGMSNSFNIVTGIKLVDKYYKEEKEFAFLIYLKIFQGFSASIDLIHMFRDLKSHHRENLAIFYNSAGNFLHLIKNFDDRKECLLILLKLNDSEVNDLVAEVEIVSKNMTDPQFPFILKALLSVPKDKRNEIIRDCEPFYGCLDQTNLFDIFAAVQEISKDKRSKLLSEVLNWIKGTPCTDLADIIITLDKVPSSERKELLKEIIYFKYKNGNCISGMLKHLIAFTKEERKLLKEQLLPLFDCVEPIHRFDLFYMFHAIPAEQRSKWINLLIPWIKLFKNPFEFIQFLELPNVQKLEMLSILNPFKKFIVEDRTLGYLRVIFGIKPELRSHVVSLVANFEPFLEKECTVTYLKRLAELERNESEELVQMVKKIDFNIEYFNLVNNLLDLDKIDRKDIFKFAIPLMRESTVYLNDILPELARIPRARREKVASSALYFFKKVKNPEGLISSIGTLPEEESDEILTLARLFCKDDKNKSPEQETTSPKDSTDLQVLFAELSKIPQAVRLKIVSRALSFSKKFVHQLENYFLL